MSIDEKLDSLGGQPEDGTIDIALRIKIEELLLSRSRYPLAALYLPESLGGNLETVRDVVHEAVDATQSAGYSIGTARTSLLAGDDYFGDGEYKLAWQQYSLAYFYMSRSR